MQFDLWQSVTNDLKFVIFLLTDDSHPISQLNRLKHQNHQFFLPQIRNMNTDRNSIRVVNIVHLFNNVRREILSVLHFVTFVKA